jgi:hypothetical protein
MSSPSPCKEFSVQLAVLAPNNQSQVSFAISKHCPPTGPLLVLDFVLRTLETNNQFQDRVRLHVTVGSTDGPEAQALADRGLTMTQLQFLQGPITARGQALAQTGQVVQSDPKLEKLISVLPHV